MRNLRGFSFLLVVLIALFISGQAYAQSDTGLNARVFGLGQPDSIHSLPPGQLRNRLESLPPQASSKALKWLQDFSFPEADLDTLEVDDEGGVFYGDTLLPDESAPGEGPTTPGEAPQATLDDAFLLHSRPGAPNVVFVDFDGATITGTAWNSTWSTLNALPFNVEGDGSTFTTLERTRIVDIWHRIAEDLAPYNIDVTTEEPASFNRYTGRILVTHSIDANNHAINCTSCGGVAYVNVFGLSNYHTYYSPALVFFDKLGPSFEPYVAEAASHEFGHNLGLSHDGTSTVGYYQGHGAGLVSWAPIMGVGYYQNVTEWSKGEYPGANNTQDDLAIIDGKLGYSPDDHGNTRATASTLSVDSNGLVISSNPELDPHNILAENKGIIGSSSDVDVFSFAAGAGVINLTVNPAWDAFYRASSNRGANLDIDIELQNVSGATIAVADPITDTKATINTSVSAGTYYLLVTGVGNTASPYSDYGSLGEYFINGSVSPASADETAPTPNPMTWASAPAAISDSAISMTATTASDETSAVEYNFLCIAGGAGCANSGWKSGSSHTATGLTAGTSYTYRTLARDQAGNQTGASGSASATTNAPPPPPLAPTGLSATGISETVINLAWTDIATTETAYRVQRSASGAGTFTTIANLGINANSYSDTGLSAATTYDYRVAALNGAVASGFATASGTTASPPPPPPYTNYGANGETPVSGVVSGSYTNTLNDGGSTQSITERDSGGKPANRYSQLEHRWNFTINAGASVTVYANAWSSGSTDGDSFDFEYSVNGGAFSFLFNVTATVNTNLQMADIPGAPSGAITIRVVDTDHSSGNREQDTVTVDHLYIQVGNPSNDPPNGNPGGMGASAVSSSQINLSWANGSSNESGLTVERSPNGSSGWATIADLPAASTTYSDSGLLAATHYYYRVSAYTQPELISGYAFANATTLVAPEPPTLSHTARGYKVKGLQHVEIIWAGASAVDVYRNGTKQGTDSNGSPYDDNIGIKGSGTYIHKVCEVGNPAVCSNPTTTVL